MKPSIPKGTRDFGPVEMLRRQYIFDTIRSVFRKYGFLPLETPAMENLATLTGKYGEEGDRLIFKILNSGDAWKEVSEQVKTKLKAGEAVHPGTFAGQVSEKALRYDLTVPFARYVVMHQHELAFPFKRYQIQSVWRADRPQKGRYREFYQCDADVIGSTSLLNEVDLLMMVVDVFRALDLRVNVHVNSRKVLLGLSQLFGIGDQYRQFFTLLDESDKCGLDVLEDFKRMGIEHENIDLLKNLIRRDGWVSTTSLSAVLEHMFEDRGVEIGLQGLKECEEIQKGVVDCMGFEGDLVLLDLSLARGLDYYTGTIFEVKAAEGTMPGSICGGGRYDDLTGVFGLKNMSGVGISFGADRIYDVLLETNKFPAELGGSTRLLFANFGATEAQHCLKLLRQVREAGIAAELYPDAVKMAKQFKYADDKGIPFVAIIGGNEMQQGIVTIKDLKSGEQKAVKQDEIVAAIQ